MYIKSLKLKSFRNYGNLEIDFSRNFNIIYGDNGQGKTNIIEAIFLCASGRSHRTSRDVDLIRLQEPGSYIRLGLNKDRIETLIEVLLKREEKKKIKINEIPAKKVGDLMGHLNAVIFSPEDLMIIKEGPSERRRFLDMTMSQLKPSYFYDLQQYSKILTQRNSLLKEAQHKRSLLDTMDIWNRNLAAVGAKIMKVRHEFIQRLSHYAADNQSRLTEGKENLMIRYAPSVKIDNFQDSALIEKNFLRTLESSMEKELWKCTTLSGPQRDDFELFLNGTNLKLYGSQGQQRTAVLSLKISEINIMKEETGEYPVLLLDDVMSELDNHRQGYLFSNLENIQTFITCTDKSFFEDKVPEDSKFFRISGGEVVL